MSRIFPFNEGVSIAFKSMVILSTASYPHSINSLAKITGASRHHIAKVLQRLAQYNLILSKPGPNGGFILNCNIKNVTLLDVFEAVEGRRSLTRIKESQLRSSYPEPFEKLSNELTHHFISILKSYTLAAIVSKEGLPVEMH